MPVPQRRSQAQISARRVPALLIPEPLAGNQHSLPHNVRSFIVQVSLPYVPNADPLPQTENRHLQAGAIAKYWRSLRFRHLKDWSSGMPSGATGKHIVNFVLLVASVKNELDRVTPLVKALATAARVVEGRIVAPTTLLSVILALYPSAGPLSSIAAVMAESDGAWRGYHDEVESSLARELIDLADAS